MDVGGVGYRASASVTTLRALPSLGEECVIHTRMVVREDAMLLFGFAAPEERAAFDALTAVSKVGPKLALAVLSAMSPPQISEAVARGDVPKLSSVPGLGRKTAERLVLELRDKLPKTITAVRAESAGAIGSDVINALLALGYNEREAQAAIKQLPADLPLADAIRQALRNLAKT